MQLTRKQKFGLITFVILLIAAYLVTKEPWKSSSAELKSVVGKPAPGEIHLEWRDLSAGYPLTPNTDTIRSYTGFDLGYNEKYEQASWVVYVLTRAEVESDRTGRSDDFRPDTSIGSGSAGLEDYRGSGYDRGHLAPAGDMKWDSVAMSESFLMSNMSPQSPSFNRGIWRKLETQVRTWAVEKDSIYVISGPVLQGISTLIGPNEVGVPVFYFKVLVDLSPPGHSMIAFLIPNEKSTADLHEFVLSVDSLEKLTSYDFFSYAPDQDLIEWMEAQLDLDNWSI